MKIDYGLLTHVKEGEEIEIRAYKDRVWQTCHIKTGTNRFEETRLLLDEDFLTLVKVSQVNQEKGQVHLKVKHKQILETSVEKKDARVLTIAVLSD
jgi:hypothetical protein